MALNGMEFAKHLDGEEVINQEEEQQECIPVPITIPPTCFHPFDCLCTAEKVRQFEFIRTG